jgi:hypothetical protein
LNFTSYRSVSPLDHLIQTQRLASCGAEKLRTRGFS